MLNKTALHFDLLPTSWKMVDYDEPRIKDIISFYITSLPIRLLGRTNKGVIVADNKTVINTTKNNL